VLLQLTADILERVHGGDGRPEVVCAATAPYP
jgi:hypothetical protein